MKRFSTYTVVVFVLVALSGCFLQNPFLHNIDGGAASLPPDQINDVSRSYTDPFKFETVLPVGFELTVNLYDSVPGGKGPDELENLSPDAANVIVTLHDSTGNLIYKGRIQEDGTLSTLLSLPAAPEDVVLTLQAEGFADRKVTIQDMRAYSEISRTMGMLSEGFSTKDLDENDTDSDGVPDDEDEFRTDPLRAFRVQIPATQSFSIAFEDLFGSARTVDADYNDFIGHYYVFEILDAKNKVVEIEGHAEAVTKIAGYNHDFGLVIDSFYGQAKLKIHYYNTTGGQIGYEESTVENYAQIPLFFSTDTSVGRTTKFNLIFKTPQLKKDPVKQKKEEGDQEETIKDPLETISKYALLDIPPYNPYLYVQKTRVYIHMIDELGLPNLTDEEDFRDDNGFPWALLIPVDWAHPEECQPIWIPYPRFLLWVESGGQLYTDWYEHNDLPTDPVLGMAADINQGGSGFPNNLIAYGDALYFSADGGDGFGYQLWKFDGLDATRQTDIIQGPSGSRPSYLTIYNGNLCFSANNGSGTSLYEYDGLSATAVSGPGSVSQLAVSSVPTGTPGDLLYFAAIDGSASYGVELWSYDGDEAQRKTDINSGAGWSSPKYLAEYNNNLYFQATDTASVLAAELWKFDGTNAPTAVNLGTGGSTPSNLIVYDGNLYFRATDGTNGYELWRYTGSTATRLADIDPEAPDLELQISPMIVYKGALYFVADDGTDGYELWSFNGSDVAQVDNFDGAGGSGMPNPAYFAIYDEELYFPADDGTNGVELWKYNGSATTRISDINPGAGDSNPRFLALWDERLYFQAQDGTSGAELWVYHK